VAPGSPQVGKAIARSCWSWRIDGLVIASLIVLDALLFWQVVFAGAFVPRGGGDLVSFIYPRYSFVAQ
jgi:hypothetical protein